MATDESELIDEIRSLTDYPTALISDSEMSNLVAIAKEELQSEVGANITITYFGSDSHNSDRALFWLSCLFAKVRAGEIGISDFTVNELKSASLDYQANFWLMMFQRRLGQLQEARGFGQGTLSRTDREYEFDAP